MERSSYFIKDRALFGSFPTQEAVEELEKMGGKALCKFDTQS